MRVIDLHCDTIGEMYDRSLGFDCDLLDINSRSISPYDEYIPVTAVWSRIDLSGDECFTRFLAAAQYAERALPGNLRRVLAVEGGKLLSGDISRLDALSSKGVKILTLTWAGINELGGAHDTDAGLTDFGRSVVRRCFELGIVPDVSHASDATFRDTAKLACEAKKPFFASHSNSRAIRKHARNLTDEMYLAVRASGGVTGVSLEPTHLGAGGGVEDAVAHIIHYFELDPDGVCLGCDFDGRTARPADTQKADCLLKIADVLLERGLGEKDVDKIFYTNAERFFDRCGVEF